jgi:hypothetical protein
MLCDELLAALRSGRPPAPAGHAQAAVDAALSAWSSAPAADPPYFVLPLEHRYSPTLSFARLEPADAAFVGLLRRSPGVAVYLAVAYKAFVGSGCRCWGDGDKRRRLGEGGFGAVREARWRRRRRRRWPHVENG